MNSLIDYWPIQYKCILHRKKRGPSDLKSERAIIKASSSRNVLLNRTGSVSNLFLSKKNLRDVNQTNDDSQRKIPFGSEKEINIKEEFNDLIELFCETVILLNEIFKNQANLSAENINSDNYMGFGHQDSTDIKKKKKEGVISSQIMNPKSYKNNFINKRWNQYVDKKKNNFDKVFKPNYSLSKEDIPFANIAQNSQEEDSISSIKLLMSDKSNEFGKEISKNQNVESSNKNILNYINQSDKSKIGKNLSNTEKQKLLILVENFRTKLVSEKITFSKNILTKILKKEIKKLNKKVHFFEEAEMIFHGEINNFRKQGIGHLVDLKKGTEYFGRVKKGKFNGDGILWDEKGFSVEGYFVEGELCGYGQKQYFSGELYR